MKVDVVSSRFSKRTPDLDRRVYYIVFPTPMCMAVLWYGHSDSSRARSRRANVQQRWRPDPLAGVLMMPLGFTLLWLQGISELIKRLAS